MGLYEYRPEEISGWLEPHFDMPPHLHAHMELIYPLDNHMQVTLNQERFVLNPGDIAVVFPNDIHKFKRLDTEGMLEIMIFSPSLLKHHKQMLMNYHPRVPFVRAKDVHPDVIYAMKMLPVELKKENFLMCTVFFELIMSRLIPLLDMEKNTEVHLFDEAHKAVIYLMEHFYEPMTLESAAAQIGISQYRLSRLFSNELGVSFTRYLRQLRVEKAKELLAGEESILNIAMSCGFETLRSFERAFMEINGVTPRDFRRMK